MANTHGEDGGPDEPPPNHLAPAILAAIACCTPVGVVAVVFAAQVGPTWSAGDREGARRASRRALRWCWVSFGIGLVVNAFWLATWIARKR